MSDGSSASQLDLYLEGLRMCNGVKRLSEFLRVPILQMEAGSVGWKNEWELDFQPHIRPRFIQLVQLQNKEQFLVGLWWL